MLQTPNSAPIRRSDGADINTSVVFWVDILLLGVAGLLSLLTLPRVLARFSPGGDWKEGHFFRSTSRPVSTKRPPNRDSMSSIVPYPNAPRHVRAPSAIVRPRGLVHALRRPALGGVTRGGAVVCVLYFALLLFAALYRTTIWTNPNRAGLVAVSQIPVVYVLAARNGVLEVMWGMAYDKLNFLHRFAGRLLVLAGNVHAIGKIYSLTLQGQWLQTISHPHFAFGLVSLILLDILFLSSLDLIRRKFHNLFTYTHLTVSVLFLVTISLHRPAARPYAIAAAAFYGLDRALRILLKSRICFASLVRIPELHTTRIHIPSLKSGWRAGQHVRLSVLSSAMGRTGWAEAHPFTIATAAGDDGEGEGVGLLCKTAGGWTSKLYAMAEPVGRTGPVNGVRVLVEGPYGGTRDVIPHSFSVAVFLVGGSGISYGLAGVQELLQEAANERSRVIIIELIWVVHHPDCLKPLLSLLTTLLGQSNAVKIDLQIAVFYTRAVTPTHDYEGVVLPLGLTLDAGRPQVHQRLRDVINRTVAIAYDSSLPCRGAFIGVCGPGSLGESVRDALGQPDLARVSETVGGVELYEEVFSL